MSEVYLRAVEPQYNVVAVSVPIVNEENLLSAILVLQIKIDHFLEWINGINIGSSGITYVVDQNGNIVGHPEFTPQDEIINFSEVPMINKLLDGVHGQEIIYDPIHPTKKVLVAYEPVPNYGWGIVVQKPVDMVFASREKSIKSLLGLYGIIFIANISLVYLMIRIFIHYQDHKDLVVNTKSSKSIR